MPLNGVARKAAAAAAAAWIGVAVLAGCERKQEPPPDPVAVSYFEAMAAGDSESAMNYIYFTAEEKADAEEMQRIGNMLRQMSSASRHRAETKDGLKSVVASEVTKEEPGENGEETASVNLEITTGDGEVTHQELNLIKTQEGWKVKL